MGKSSAPPPPDYTPIANAMQNSADQSFQLGQQQFDWAKNQYAQDQATLKPIIDQQVQTQQQAADFAKQQQDFYTGTYQPLEQQFASNAASWDSPDREQQNAGQAEGAVNQQFDQARSAATQQLESYGVDPSATRYGSLDIGTRTAQAAATAAAGTKAITDTQQQGLALQQQAINTGRSYSGAISGANNTAIGAGGAASGETNQATSTGASTMGTAPQYQSLGNSSLGSWGNTLNQGYSNALGAFNANSNASSGWGSALGLGASMLGKGGAFASGGALAFLSDGGAIPDDSSQGGAIPTSASPTRGQVIDDVPARLTPGEFVVPKDAVSWLGEKHFQDLIEKARKAKAGATAKPEYMRAPPQAPTFASRPTAGALPV